MRTVTIVGIALAAGTLAGTGLLADTFKKYGSEGGWDIRINEEMGPGCLIVRKDSDGTQIQMGINATAPDLRGYIAIYVKAAAGITAGQAIPAKFDVGGEVFDGTFTGQQIDGYDGAYVQVNNPEFVYRMSENKTMTISPEGRDPLVIDLSGTEAALAAMRTCQEAQ